MIDFHYYAIFTNLKNELKRAPIIDYSGGLFVLYHVGFYFRYVKQIETYIT